MTPIHDSRKRQLAPSLFFLLSLLLITPHRIQASTQIGIIEEFTEPTLTKTFPSVSDALEFAHVANAIYYLNKRTSCKNRHIPDDVTCVSYEETPGGSQVMVGYSEEKSYIVVAYAGTDELKNWITDLDISVAPFGPIDAPLFGDDVLVHEGFNDAVFSDGLFDRVLLQVRDLSRLHPSFRLISTGHSLGAADSVLTGAALSHYFPDRNIEVFNYGCPKTGGKTWMRHVNAISNLGIWRFVFRDDIVPRVPRKRFSHVGHTVELYKHSARAFYLHHGDGALGYLGVPWNWDYTPFSFVPASTMHHHMSWYIGYLKKKSTKHPEKYFVTEFATKYEVGEHETFEEEFQNMDNIDVSQLDDFDRELLLGDSMPDSKYLR